MSKRCLGCMEYYGDEFEICPHCGYIEGTPAEEAIHMEPGTILHDRYIVGKVLGFGGFGVTYIGWDGRLEQKVAIKEYLPSEFSTRMPGQSTVTVFNGEKEEQFRDGLEKFVDEAKRLAKFQNEPGIVKIFDSFSENDTAYIIMEYLDGETLTERLKREQVIPEDEAVAMLWPVMKSLQSVHNEGILHRDIAPDNIFLTKDGEVKLIDFGASRYATTSHSRSLTVIIKPGYSPEEQYRSRGDQGTYTDVYALAATLYKMITGVTPPDAMERRAMIENKKKELLENPHKLDKRITINRENAILNAMNVRIEDRTSDVQTFMDELNADPPAKRVYGKIKKIDLYQWPLWLKIAVPSVLGIVVILGVLLATGVINIGSLFSEKVVVPDGVVIAPDVEGMDKDEAVAQIEDMKLFASASGNVTSEYVEAGKIVLQSPVGGSYIDEFGTISLTVSSGKGVVEAKDGIATVPYVIWDTKADAIEKLKKAGLGEPKIEEKYDDTVEAGRVISQSEKQGTKLDEGTKITLVISKGPESFSMPDVKGKNIDTAREELSAKGLTVSTTYESSSSVDKDKVISQSISAGTKVKKGEKITLTVSSGSGNTTVTVPNVVGKSRSAAESALDAAGLNVSVVENYDNNVDKGYVISQSPSSGSQQSKGATITLYVSKGKQSSDQPKQADKKIKVTLDANGGSVSDGSMTVNITQDPYYGSLPTPTRDCYTFKGWYTDGGRKVMSGDSIAYKSDHTLYAKWAENPLSDWVPEAEAPIGGYAKVVDERWEYDQTTYTTSDKSSLPGWTQYDSKTSYSAYGNWSDWSENYVSGSNTREVQTQQVEYCTMKGYCCGDTAGYRCYLSSYPRDGYRLRLEYPQFDVRRSDLNGWEQYGQGSWYGYATNVQGYIIGPGTGYIAPWEHVPYFVIGTYNKTEYRYRDRSQSTTYYYRKTEHLISDTDPGGLPDVSNVMKYVRYREK